MLRQMMDSYLCWGEIASGLLCNSGICLIVQFRSVVGMLCIRFIFFSYLTGMVVAVRIFNVLRVVVHSDLGGRQIPRYFVRNGRKALGMHGRTIACMFYWNV